MKRIDVLFWTVTEPCWTVAVEVPLASVMTQSTVLITSPPGNVSSTPTVPVWSELASPEGAGLTLEFAPDEQPTC
jgi:hypothetical protein